MMGLMRRVFNAYKVLALIGFVVVLLLFYFQQSGYGPTDRRTDGQTDGWMDIPSYRDAIDASKNFKF